MNIEQLRNYCMAKKGVTEHFPFDNITLVFKVMNKMFTLTSLHSWEQGEAKINLKCNPQWALKLREEYENILPGWHMNKKHWNTILINNTIADAFIFELIDHSYSLVVKGLTKKAQIALHLL
ncbi:MmcQ/YjbR family DNA-binding protein [Tenacibaculum finnmarkense]|uniref:MmcQ/YjbR family DNA-binding protein n=1 Tax=Tenacibaculum finnmarkense TaxID=2781243 RepID=UPI00187B3476|nr:MmcQ/YjbR family DNA-binding protein [Tenacibaculum finnmarkense]MBE7648511.1 MmcQ/YjbR family DNA-binding protein [Tenacibaculum finnmarkense genomovar ulcerans]MCG8796216.1 MmcQ/YjbR family DNA-binding protein [Tenacibaculum finnmarkense]MCG8798324.1 MmcQ/YjbR family DNA-binding protein [Tenacibaculum finnmarkense]